MPEYSSVGQYRSINQADHKNRWVSIFPPAIHDTHPPPMMDMMQAVVWMTPECAKTIGRANPVTTTMDVMKRPRSIAPELSSLEKSSEPQ